MGGSEIEGNAGRATETPGSVAVGEIVETVVVTAESPEAGVEDVAEPAPADELGGPREASALEPTLRGDASALRAAVPLPGEASTARRGPWGLPSIRNKSAGWQAADGPGEGSPKPRARAP